MADQKRPNSDDVRGIVTTRVDALQALKDIKETVTVEWRGEQKTIPVISMPVELLAYNPATCRIRAQRSLEPGRDAELEAHPYSDSAQAYLHELLMGDPADPSKRDPAFEVLKEDLKQHGQSEPGIITDDGVLINGNTRCAALKELGQRDIRVGVLPKDAGIEDFENIELSLQLRKDHRRDYSFMNLLLAIDERVQAGWHDDQIQQQFRIRASTLERSKWILATVRELISRSEVELDDGNRISLRLIDFERHQGKLEELYRKYSGMKIKAPDEAEAMKEQRLLAIARDKSKTDVRWIEEDFNERFLKLDLPEPDVETPDTKHVPGTTIEIPTPSPQVEGLKQVTTEVLRAGAITQSPDAVPDDTLQDATETIRQIDEALDDALNKAGRSGRVVKTRFAPVDRLTDANDVLQLTIEALAEARAASALDPTDLDEALKDTRAKLLELAQLISNTELDGADSRNDEDSEGIAWLISVAETS